MHGVLAVGVHGLGTAAVELLPYAGIQLKAGTVECHTGLWGTRAILLGLIVQRG